MTSHRSPRAHPLLVLLLLATAFGQGCRLLGQPIPCEDDGDCPLEQRCAVEAGECQAAGPPGSDGGGDDDDDAGPAPDAGGPVRPLPEARCTPAPTGVVVQPGPFFEAAAPERRPLLGGVGDEDVLAIAPYGEDVLVGGVVHASLLLPGTAEDLLLEAGGDDVFLARVTQNGLARWAFAAGSSTSSFGESLTDVVVDSEGCLFVAGVSRGGTLLLPGCPALSEAVRFDEHAFIAHVDVSTGECVWAVELRGGDDGVTQKIRAPVLAAVPGGGVVVAATVDRGATLVDSRGGAAAVLGDRDDEEDFALARLTARGEVMWARLIGDASGLVEPRALVARDDAAFLCANGTALSVDLGGDTALTLATDGAVLARYALADGTLEAALGLPVEAGGVGATCKRLVLDDERLVFGGEYEGTLFGTASRDRDLFVAEAPLSLASVASLGSFGDFGDEDLDGLAVASDGHVLVGATVRASSVTLGGVSLQGDSALPDPVVFDFVPGVGVTSARRFVGDGRDLVRDLTLTGEGRVYLVGVFDGAIDIDGAAYTATGDDVFFVRFGP